MKFQWVLLFSLAVLCLGKPAKRSAGDDTDSEEDGEETKHTSTETGANQNATKKKCPTEMKCVTMNQCEEVHRRANYNCTVPEMVCCYQPPTSERRRRSTPQRQHRLKQNGGRLDKGRQRQNQHQNQHQKHRNDRKHDRKHDRKIERKFDRKIPLEAHHYMDYYDANYEKVFGPTLSPHAKSIFTDYRPAEECGVRHESPQLLARVSSGYLHERGLTSFGEFPWHVAVLVKERVFRTHYTSRPREDLRYKCGGTLINDKFVITAAHCVFGERLNRLKVHLGEWNLDGSTGELFPSVERTIASVHIHTGFDPSTYAHDIALLRMSSAVDFSKTPHISPVCFSTNRFDHKKCYVVGWGDDVYKPNFGSNVLRAVSVLFVNDIDVCRAKFFTSFKDNTLQSTFNLDEEHQKCVIGEYGKDACVGDGGGAVVCPLSNAEKPVKCNKYKCADKHYFMAGIISFGSPNCGESSATIVTEITPNINWINAITSQTGY